MLGLIIMRVRSYIWSYISLHIQNLCYTGSSLAEQFKSRTDLKLTVLNADNCEPSDIR